MGDCKTCTGCKEKKTKAELPENIPYIAYDMAQARNERHIKRMTVALIVAIALMFVSNMMWLWAWNSYNYTSEETIYTQDGEGTNIIGNQNEVDNGADPYNSESNEN